MDPILQALIMGIVQGLTEFLPVSSSGHLLIVPWLFGWDDAFITSLAFSVMLHLGTLVALLVYFRADWLRLVPAGLATIRDRSFRGRSGPDARLAAGRGDRSRRPSSASCSTTSSRRPGPPRPALVAVTLVVGGVILWIADRVGRRTRRVEDVTFPIAVGIGAAQALALIPGISRSGISISAGRFAGLDRESAARFAFLMATPITAGAIVFEAAQARDRASPASTSPRPAPRRAGRVARGRAAGHPASCSATCGPARSTIFVWYRFVLAAVVDPAVRRDGG